MAAPDPDRGICVCGLAWSYHDGRLRAPGEYLPRYPVLDPDPLHVEPGGIIWESVPDTRTYDKPRSPAVILYLAVILAAIATGAIIALLWWGLR